MTDAEAERVKVGDLLHTVITGRIAVVRVMRVLRVNADRPPYFDVARRSRFLPGMPSPTYHRSPKHVELVQPTDPDAAGVYADFLEEMGEAAAAALLRAAFPARAKDGG